MADQKLSLIISAIDRASGPLDSIMRKINGIGAQAAQAAKGTDGLSNAIAFGMVKAQAAIGAVTMGYQKLTGMVQQASRIQLENQTAAQTLAAIAGQSFDEAAGFVDRMNASLAKSAATLPGVTSDYTALARSITDNVATSFKGADGTIKDMRAFEKTLTSLSESFGVLSASSNVPVQNTALGLTKLLSGGSTAELRQIQFFEQNPAILNEIETRLQAVGAKSFKDIDVGARVKLVQEVGEKYVTGEFKTRAGETVDGLIQGFVSGFFDPMSGVFGLMRDLDEKTEGVQSAFLDFNALLKSLIGESGLFGTITKAFESLGFTVDPMQVLSKVIKWLDLKVQQLNGFVSRLVGSGALSGITDFGDAIARAFNFLGARARAFVSGDAFANIGETIAKVINQISAVLVGAITGIDTGQSAGFGQDLIMVIFREIGDALAGLSWQSWAVIGAGLLAGPILGAIGTFAAGIAAPFLAAVAGAPVLLAIGAGAALGLFTKVVIQRWDEITAMAGGLFTAIGTAFSGGIKMAIGVLTLNLPLIQAGMQQLVSGINDWLNRIRDTWAVLTGGKTTGQQKADDAASQAEARYQAAIKAKKGSDGYIPNAASGFMPVLDAIARERKAMPAGAGLIVANSTETILTQRQTAAVGQALGSSGGNTFNVSFNITGSSNPEDVARQVMRHMQILFDEHLQGQLA